MSTIDTLRRKAEQAAEALTKAQAKAGEEAAAIRQRNADRTAAFWADASSRCVTAHKAATQARSTVVDLVAAGDLAGALSAYGEYAKRVTEADVTRRLAQHATGTYVWTEVRQIDPDAKPRKVQGSYQLPATEHVEQRALVTEWGRDHSTPPTGARTVYPAGVQGSTPRRDSLDRLLTEGLDRLEDEHAATFTASLLQPLRDQLETEDA